MRRNHSQPYLDSCTRCGRATSKAYARAHDGMCKPCATGEPSPAERRNAIIIDCGYEAYAREEGHYDTGDR